MSSKGYVYIWVRVPAEVYDLWVNKLSRSEKREIGRMVAETVRKMVERRGELIGSGD